MQNRITCMSRIVQFQPLLLFAVNEPFHGGDVDSAAQCALGRKFWKILKIVVDCDDDKRVAVG